MRAEHRAPPPPPSPTDRRKKVTAIGWLVICAASILNESHGHYWGTPSLSWLVLLCATWALIVWLFPENAFGAVRNWRRSRLILKRRRLLCRIVELKKASRVNDEELQLMLLNTHPDSKAFGGCDIKGPWRKLPMCALLAIESSLETMAKLYVFNARKLKKKIESGAIPEWFADKAARVVFRRENAKWHELPCQKLAELPELWKSADANPDNRRGA